MDSSPVEPLPVKPTADTPKTQAPAAAPQPEGDEPTANGEGAVNPTAGNAPEPPVEPLPEKPTADTPKTQAPAAAAHMGATRGALSAAPTPAERESEPGATPSITGALAGSPPLDDATSPGGATTPIPAQTPVVSPPERLRSDDQVDVGQPASYGHAGPSPSERAVTLRRTAGPAFPATSGYSEKGMLDALPPQLAEKVQGLPVAYTELAKSYRQAQATRTGTKPAKRNIRLHAEVAIAVKRQMVSDKRMLKLRDLTPSQYVDAAITLARHISVTDLIKAADEFRDSHLGEASGSASPNHYSIRRENDAWLDDMMDELLLANTTGLHGHMVNVILQSFLEQLRAEAPATG
ncbi:hypothetical protein [Streptomyces sp. NPDC059611]|uniref:hypothetical protein n=1 Tax=Streptomyces sp. NPDC059611 TaxID=3346884 RepID=UPI00369E602C